MHRKVPSRFSRNTKAGVGIIVGVVGVLQFDVLRFRLENEYNVEIRLENLPYEHIRWIENKEEVDVDALTGISDMKKVIDMKGNPLLYLSMHGVSA